MRCTIWRTLWSRFPGYEGLRPVQRGVWYSPMLEFMLFDICTTSNTSSTYLSYSATIALAKEYNIFHANPLYIGTYAQASTFNPKFISTIAPQLEYQSPEKNFAEGIVIRELDASHETNDSSRAIVKRKISEFEEGSGCPPAECSFTYLQEWILSLINTNRLAAAYSKVGDPRNRDNWDAIVALTLADVQEEVGEEHSDVLSYLRCQLLHVIHNLLAEHNANS